VGTFVVGFACLVGPAGATTPLRVALHSFFGSLLFATLAVKFTVLRLRTDLARLLPLAGIFVFVSFVGIWATSVADYISAR
jgi:hypothetical protein